MNKGNRIHKNKKNYDKIVKKSDILKTKKKLKIKRDNIEDYYVMYTMTSKINKSMQKSFMKKYHFQIFSST